MKQLLKNEIFYRFLALLILAVFYGVYYGKKLIQKKSGIRTNQIGTRKEREIHTVEIFMSIATVSIVIVQLISIVIGFSYTTVPVRIIGFFIGLIGDMIFLISVICMKDSWRAGIPQNDKTKLVTNGIYSFSRNPAFLGFDLMYIGILLLYCNLFTAVFSAFAIIMLHLQILQEEKYMASTFGEEYLNYKHKTMRYFGRKHCK